MGIKHLAQLVAHKLHSLIFDGVTLGVRGYHLHVRRVLAQFLIVLLVCRRRSLSIARQQTVHHSVGIAAYRRCKVSVVVECQTEVTYVVHGILSLHHRSESHHLDEFLLAFAVTFVHKVIERASRLALCTGGLHAIAKLHDEVLQVLQFERIRIVMHTIRQSLRLLTLLHLAHAFRHGAVGEQHEFLHEVVGLNGLFEIAAYRFALLIKFEFHLLALKLYRAIGKALVTQLFCYGPQLAQFGSILALRVCRFVIEGVAVLEYLLHLIIDKAAVALDDGVHYAVFQYIRIVINIEDHTICKFLLIGTQ